MIKKLSISKNFSRFPCTAFLENPVFPSKFYTNFVRIWQHEHPAKCCAGADICFPARNPKMMLASIPAQTSALAQHFAGYLCCQNSSEICLKFERGKPCFQTRCAWNISRFHQVWFTKGDSICPLIAIFIFCCASMKAACSSRQ